MSTILFSGSFYMYTVFGYGSLIFKPPPHVLSQAPGFLKGYVRRFAQSSNDHRGTPENLGRVVTLISASDWANYSASDPFPNEDIVWGVAYTIDPTYASEVRDYLDHREKNGYSIHHTDVYGFRDGVETVLVRNAVVYVGKTDNPAFVGSESLEELALRIYTSVGPSGSNKVTPNRYRLLSLTTPHQEYLYELTRAVRQLAPQSEDLHLSALFALVKELDDSCSMRSNMTASIK